jgi:hypothetical protein
MVHYAITRRRKSETRNPKPYLPVRAGNKLRKVTQMTHQRLGKAGPNCY